MTASRTISCVMAVLVAAVSLGGCKQGRDPGFQGWVEADMIFVSPDETGRVTKLNVREGDEVKVGDQLYSVDDDLQQADLAQVKASVKNAQQTFDRASMLVRTGAGTQKDFDAAEMVLRDERATARRNGRTLRSRVRAGFVQQTIGGNVSGLGRGQSDLCFAR